MMTRDYDLYQMTEERQQTLWEDCIFVFDTSALLALYLYPAEARQHIYKEIFEKIKGRLWIPEHVLFEFLKNKASKIREPISRSYKPLADDYIKPIVDAFNRSLNRVDALKNSLKNADTHPYFVSEELEKYELRLKDFLKTTVEFEQSFTGQMTQKINEILALEQHDTVYESIRHYFEVGREYSYEEILKITVEGKHRYEFKIPPGYEDLKDKIGTQIFGDLIIWKQVLEYAKENKKNLVFICNDLKEDWWHLVSDKKNEKKRTNGPRKELIKEFKDHSGQVFWMYHQAKFLDIANTLIKSNVPNRYIEQISRLAGSGNLDKWLVYTCATCNRINTLDTATLSLSIEPAGRGPENRYVATTGFTCPHCHAAIQARFEIHEQPTGVIQQREIVLTGATLMGPGQMEEHLQEGWDDVHEPMEEEFIIDNKQLRLKAGKTRKIRFKKPVEGDETLFQVTCIKTDAGPAKRLLLEAFNRQKRRITKTLVLESGTTRFVMQSEEEQFARELHYVLLTPDVDMTLVLSVTAYPGTGRYLEKLQY